MTYTTLDVDGTEAPMKMRGKKPTLEEMQAVVGGYIERVSFKGGEMWVNEDGLGLGLPVNVKATELAQTGAFAGNVIVGRVLVSRFKKRASKTASVERS